MLALALLVLAAPDAERLAWLGVARGPLSPARAAALEALLLDELDGYESLRLVDASGQALDDRLLASDTAQVAKLKDRGVDVYLRGEHRAALVLLEEAISIFEARLLRLSDHELYHDALLARAEVLFAMGEKGSAEDALKALVALGPKDEPDTSTHDKVFVKRWEAAKKKVGPPGRLNLSCALPDCRVQLDGQNLGSLNAPLLVTRILPGKHTVVAAWSHAVATKIVAVAPGKETKLSLAPSGPGEEARAQVMEGIARRAGAESMPALYARVTASGGAQGALVAIVRPDLDNQTWLVLLHHGADGQLLGAIRGRLEDADAPLVRALATALFVDKRAAEQELTLNSARAVSGLAAFAYDKVYALPEVAPAATTTVAFNFERPASPPPEDGLSTKWWFWALLGGVVVGGAVSAAFLLQPKDPTTTIFEVRLP